MGNRDRTHVPIYEARTRHSLGPSKPSKPVLAFARTLSPLYARFILRYEGFDLKQAGPLLTAFRDFEEGRIRLIVAFRHPYGDEPQLVHHVIDSLLQREARRSGEPLPYRPHARFVHGYEVALWGDAIIRWILPRSGALPVHHLHADPAGMKAIRAVMLDGQCPLALAPEGQVSYRSATVPRLEPGTARMAFWLAKDLEKQNRPEKAVILPLTVLHEYRQKDAARLVDLIRKLEKQCGIAVPQAEPSVFAGTRPAGNPGFAAAMRDRLVALEWRVIALAEAHYHEICGYLPPQGEDTPDAAAPQSGESGAGTPSANRIHDDAARDYDRRMRQQRWDGLMEAALQTGERMLGLAPHVSPSQDMPKQDEPSHATPSHDTPSQDMPSHSTNAREAILEAHVQRVYRIRREGWDRIFPLQPVDGFSPFEKSLRHRMAGEAWYAMRHMEFVDLVEYLDPEYLDAEGLPDGPSYNRLTETALNLYDLVQRLSGGNFTNRINPFPKKAVILPGTPIDVSARLPAFRTDMRQAVADTTRTLKQAYLETLSAYESTRRQHAPDPRNESKTQRSMR